MRIKDKRRIRDGNLSTLKDKFQRKRRTRTKQSMEVMIDSKGDNKYIEKPLEVAKSEMFQI